MDVARLPTDLMTMSLSHTRHEPPPIPPRSPLRLLATQESLQPRGTTSRNIDSDVEHDDYSVALNCSINQFLNSMDANSFSRASTVMSQGFLGYDYEYDCGESATGSRSPGSRLSTASAASSCYALSMPTSPSTSYSASSGLNAPPSPRSITKGKTFISDDMSLSQATTIDLFFDMVDQLATPSRLHTEGSPDPDLSREHAGLPQTLRQSDPPIGPGFGAVKSVPFLLTVVADAMPARRFSKRLHRRKTASG